MKVVFGCVTDTNGPYVEHAARLLLSLRWFGGTQARAPFVLCVVGELSEEQKAFFLRHEAEIINVERFDQQHGPSNKLRYFQQERLDEYDYIALLDCDTIVVQDPSEWLCCEGFAAKPADAPTVSVGALSSYLETHDIALPSREFHHDVADVPGLPYFNSGVVILASRWRQRFIRSWVKYNRDLLANCNQFGITPFHVDQASLTAAVLAEAIPIQSLPTSMNFPAHLLVDRYPQRVWEVDPVIIHYHGLFDYNGYINSLPFPHAGLRSRMFNSKLHAERGSRFTMKPTQRSTGPKVIVGTGWWSSEASSQWSIGSEEIRSPGFFDLWYRQVAKCIIPTAILVTDSHSPLKPVWADYPGVQWIELDKNYGHPNDLRTGKVQTKFSGYTRSVLHGAMYAYCCDADYYVYLEQDCLVRGDNFLAHAIGNSCEDILLGDKTTGGVGIEGRPAAPMHQNSLIIVARAGLERFISGILNSAQGDGELSIELIMECQCAPFGILSVPYGRSRPITYQQTHFYAQHMTAEELRSFLDAEATEPLHDFPSILSV